MSAGELILETGVYDMPFLLTDRQATRMAYSGFSQVVDFAEPFWSFDLSTQWLTPDQFQTWEAWLLRRRSGAVTFTAWKMSRPYGRIPVQSDAGLVLSSVDRANSTISFTGTGSWTASEGDMISYRTANGGYYLGSVQETKTAVSGAMPDLKVAPFPLEPHSTTKEPRRIMALGEFRLKTPVPKQIERVDERFISFSAEQIIRG